MEQKNGGSFKKSDKKQQNKAQQQNIVITIPAYNEEQSIAFVINEIKSVMGEYIMQTAPYLDYKILVVNDGSTDRTEGIVQSLGAVVVSHKTKGGLAQAFRTEMKSCLRLGADIIVHTDGDGQYPAQYIPQLLSKVNEGYDLALGSRFLAHTPPLPLMKVIGNRAFAKVISSIIKQKITDSTTGFRAFTKEIAEQISLISDFTYTQDQIIQCARNGYKIAEIPIYARKTRESRLFKSPLEYAFKAWLTIFRIYRNYEPLKFFGKAGIAFITAGLLIGLYLIYNFLAYGIVGHVPATILSALLILTGVQIVFFGFLADMNRR